MIKSSTIISLSFIFYIIIFSCVKKSELTPADPIWSKEICSHCGMILSEKRYAVQRIISAGKIYFYDDLNCALKHEISKEEKNTTLFVRPHGGDDWLDAKTVNFNEGLVTPMNSGFGAVKADGKLNFPEVESRILKK